MMRKVEVKRVRTNKRAVDKAEFGCRLVAQELGHGEQMDDVFASRVQIGLAW